MKKPTKFSTFTSSPPEDENDFKEFFELISGDANMSHTPTSQGTKVEKFCLRGRQNRYTKQHGHSWKHQIWVEGKGLVDVPKKNNEKELDIFG